MLSMTIAGISVRDEPFEAILRQYCVKELSIFGSRVRDDNRPDSDLDMLVLFEPDSRIDLFDFVELKLALEDLLGMTVDLGSKNFIKPRVRERILAEARVIYPL